MCDAERGVTGRHDDGTRVTVGSACLGGGQSRTQSGLSAAAPSESSLGEAVMDAEVANCSASKHGPGQSVKFLAAREHIDNQLYALDLCL